MDHLNLGNNSEKSPSTMTFRKTMTSYLHKVPFLSSQQEKAYSAFVQAQPSVNSPEGLPSISTRASFSQMNDDSIPTYLFPPNTLRSPKKKYTVVVTSFNNDLGSPKANRLPSIDCSPRNSFHFSQDKSCGSLKVPNGQSPFLQSRESINSSKSFASINDTCDRKSIGDVKNNQTFDFSPKYVNNSMTSPVLKSKSPTMESRLSEFSRKSFDSKYNNIHASAPEGEKNNNPSVLIGRGESASQIFKVKCDLERRGSKISPKEVKVLTINKESGSPGRLNLRVSGRTVPVKMDSNNGLEGVRTNFLEVDKSSKSAKKMNVNSQRLQTSDNEFYLPLGSPTRRKAANKGRKFTVPSQCAVITDY